MGCCASIFQREQIWHAIKQPNSLLLHIYLIIGLEKFLAGEHLSKSLARGYHLLPNPVLRRLVECGQYVSIRYSERLAEAGIEPSVGSKGDSYDNALSETINGLYKTELIRKRTPWKSREAVELATLEWVAWFNHHRLLEPIGYIPPAEAEAKYYRQLAEKSNSEVLT